MNCSAKFIYQRFLLVLAKSLKTITHQNLIKINYYEKREIKMKKLEAVIFDWAGTTVDYGCFAPVQAFIEAFKSFGITPTNTEVREPMGMLKRDHVKTMLDMPRIKAEWIKLYGSEVTEADIDKVYEKSERAILDVVHNFASPNPFVLETIAELRNRGIKIGSTTGYTQEMMDIVLPAAKENGYTPDSLFTPDSVSNLGRPYPFMVYHNMEALKVSSVNAVIKVGDTVADIKEGKSAGIISVGIVEGSSAMGLSKEEYDALSDTEKAVECERVTAVYKKANADYIIQTMGELCDLIDQIEAE